MAEAIPVVGNGGVLIKDSEVDARVLADGQYGSGIIVSDGEVVVDNSTVEVGANNTYNFGIHFRSAPHVHEFIERIADDAHVATAATCTDPAHYYCSCVCGEVGTDTFASGDPLGHAFKDGACVVCGAEDLDYVPLESPEQPSDQPADDEGEEEGSSALPATGDAASPLAVAAFVSASLAGLVAIGAGMLARRRRNG